MPSITNKLKNYYYIITGDNKEIDFIIDSTNKYKRNELSVSDEQFEELDVDIKKCIDGLRDALEDLTCDKLFEKEIPQNENFYILKKKNDYWNYLSYFEVLFDGRKVFNDIRSALEKNSVLKFDRVTTQTGLRSHKTNVYYLFGSKLWDLEKNDQPYINDPEKFRLLFLESFDKERNKFEKLTRKFSSDIGTLDQRRREKISEDVRVFVWRRDEGRCVQCGSDERLEFDHIIPVSKGGSNTARNIQLLCEFCNRSKSDRI